MVARIHTSKSIQKVLNYNEQKVGKGDAVALHAEGFLKDVGRLSFYDKCKGFQRLTELNERAQTNAMHISLNFDPSEALSGEKMTAIATAYMKGIGFEDQPYVVYRHNDAGHPHLHIVTTNIRRDGSRISLHGIGRVASERARKEIEVAFGLVPAQRRQDEHEALRLQKVVYGQGELRKAIANVLTAVLPRYRYSSLAELNALLRLYGLCASRGGAGSRTYQRGGLFYQALDSQGLPAGRPLKASTLPRNPGLRYLHAQFRQGQAAKVFLKDRLRSQLDWALTAKGVRDWDTFRNMLLKAAIEPVLHQNGQGQVYGVTFVDHRQKAVFKGSDVGKSYSANSIADRWIGINKKATSLSFVSPPFPSGSYTIPVEEEGQTSVLLDRLLYPEQVPNPSPLPGKKRRKKRKGNHPS